jgi:hypothetical protein
VEKLLENIHLENEEINWRITVKYFKNGVFWDVTPFKSCVNRRFGGTYHLHLQDRKIRE